MGLAKYLPGGEKSPGGAIHRGINKAIGIDENFMAPDPIQQRLEANRTGDSQWQKFNPVNLRDYNENMGYDYAGGGRDPVEEAMTAPTAPFAPLASQFTAPQGGPPVPGLGGPPVNPMGGMQRQFTQAQQLRRPPNVMARRG